MISRTHGRVRVGSIIGGRLTVLGVVDRNPGRHPVYIVWNHDAWCPMACKLFRSTRRAEREASALQRFAHPNIVRVLGVGAPGYMLTEFLEGPTVARLIDRRADERLPIADALRIAIHVGSALELMHRQGFVHLDIKPHNIIVARSRPVLFDFGTVRKAGAKHPGVIAGTDPYIAPEECLKQRVWPAADVFSLGVSLYEMLTGELPFPEGSRSRPFTQLTRAPTSARKHRPAIPAALDALILSCLARDPKARPALGAFIAGLNTFIRRGPRMWPEGFAPMAGPKDRLRRAA